MENTYSQYLTLQEFKEQTGYDLTKRAEQGDFNSREEAASNFMQTCFDELVDEVIKPNKGPYWTKNFLIDVKSTDTSNPILEEMKLGFKKALKEHILYRWEVGDPVACADSNLPRYSEHCINILINSRILQRGY